MKIPEKVKIGGQIYDVIVTDKVEVGGRTTYSGAIMYSESTIELRDDLKGSYAEITFLHEILHGLFEFANFEFDDEEDIVERLSYALYMLIKDNPEMFEKEE